MTRLRRKRFHILLAACAMAAAAPRAAEAHPHVWITMHSDIVFGDDGRVTGFNMDWTFDDAYTKLAIDGLDTNGDGVISDDELANLTRNNLTVLKDYDYFTVARFDGEKLAVTEATDYGQIYSDNKLEMHFHLPLREPVDPRQGRLTLQIYDPDFFVDLEYGKNDPFEVLGNIPSQCRAVLQPPPTSAQLEQTRAMLATKGTDWKPENGEDFGSLFAQVLEVQCKS
jgi:ABC-type uncharacterized transport system substrate-binding protein